MMMIWRLLFPPDMGITEAPSFSAPYTTDPKTDEKHENNMSIESRMRIGLAALYSTFNTFNRDTE
jgi:hypothetical protein